MSEKYWETGERPVIVDAGKQRYKFYQAAQVLEICTVKEEDKTEIRRQTISAHKLKNNPELRDMLLNFLEDTELIQTVKE